MLSQAQKQVSRKVLGADAASEVAQTAESTKKLHTSAAASAIGSLALVGICTLAFSVRLFSVIKYESVIHEFDPYFNYRVTQFLTKHGFYELWNWFDDLTWYPLGRVIGGTVYPGLIYTAGIMWNVLHFFNIPLHVQEVCVFTAPLFSSLCALATYLFVKEIKGQGAGLLASAFVATVPSYISRSVAGSYDNEGVAIFALVFTFYLYVKTINTGSLSWATANALAYWYMVLSWGGYTFIINLLPIHCLACVFLGRLNSRVYVAFAPLIVLGTIEAASIPVVGFNAVLMSEHFGAFFAFLVLHAAMGIKYIKGILPEKTYQSAKILALTVGIGGVAVAITLMVGYVAASPTFGWTGRSLSLLDPTYASKYIPIIASVSEHQPPTWSSYFTDINVMVLLMPLGLLACFRPLTDSSLFLILYGVTAAYFSGVMVRLMLVLAPAACCLAGIAADEIMHVLAQAIRAPTPAAAPATSGLSTSSSLGSGERSRLDKQVSGGKRGKVADRKDKDKRATPVIDWLPPTLSCAPQRLPHCWQPVACYAAPVAPVLMLQWREDKKASSEVDRLLPALARAPQRLPRDLAACGLLVLAAMLITYMFHCCWVSADMYSAPSIVLQSRGRDGQLHVFDDFREAYAWLRHNTEEDAKIASWWDYGYQTTAMANRTVLVDNNTWNNTHIATVGRAMASPEKQAWTTFKALDTKYVLVVFGGFIGYPSDDINKFLWMVRIGGGVFPDIKEADYLGPRGYTIDDSAGKAMLDSIMYKMCYYRFADAAQMVTGQYGFDRVRNTPIGVTDVKLRYFEEVFTSEHWMVRIYAVKDQPSTDIKLRNPRRSKSIVKRPRTGRAVVAPW